MALRMKHIAASKYEVDIEGAKDLQTVLGELEAAGIDLAGFRITHYNHDKNLLCLTKQETKEISRVEFRAMQNKVNSLGINDNIFDAPTPTLGYLRKY